MRTIRLLSFALAFVAQLIVPVTAFAAAGSVSGVSPLTAVLNQSTTFTVSGKQLPNTLAFFIDNCANLQTVSRSSTQQVFRCTPQKSGTLSGLVKDKPNGITLRSFAVVVKAPAPVVSSVAPLTATLNQSTLFSVTGTNLPDTLAFFIADCAGLVTVSRTATRQDFRCTPQKTGTLSGLVKDKPNGTTLRNFTIGVKTPTPVVSSVSPLAVTANQLTTFTVDGVNLPMTIAFDVAECKDKKMLSHTSSRVQFSCTPGGSGNKSGVIKDKPNGAVLRNFSVSVKAGPVISSITFSKAELNTSLTVTVSGTLLPADLQLSIPTCNQMKRVQYSTTKHVFSCTPTVAGVIQAQAFLPSNNTVSLVASVTVLDDVGNTPSTARSIDATSKTAATIHGSDDLDVYKFVVNGGNLELETTGSILTLVTLADENGVVIDQIVSGQQNLDAVQKSIVTLFSLPAMPADAVKVGDSGTLFIEVNPGTYYVTVESLINLQPVKDGINAIENVKSVRKLLKEAVKGTLNDSIQSIVGKHLLDTTISELAWAGSGLAKAANGSYTLVMNYTSASPKGAKMWMFPTDVKSSDWYFEAVDVIATPLDFPEGKFYPEQQVKREKAAEWTSVAIRWYPGWSQSLSPCTSAPFTDVSAQRGSCAYIAHLKSLDVLPEEAATKSFRPEDGMTRLEAARLMVRAFRLAVPACKTEPFADIKTTDPLCPSVQAMKKNGLMSASSSGLFNPQEKMTRASFIHLLDQTYMHAMKEQTMAQTPQPTQIVCSGPIELCLGGNPGATLPQPTPDPIAVVPPTPAQTPVFSQDGNDTFEGAFPLLENKPFSTSIDHAADKDMYVFTPLKRNGTYGFQVFGRKSDATIKPSKLYDQQKNLLMKFGDSPAMPGAPDGYFYGFYRLSAGSTYYLEVSDPTGGLGEYDIVIQGPTFTNDKDDFGNDPISGYTLVEKELVKGQIEVKKDEDYFTFTPKTDGNYVVELGATNMFQATIMSNSYWLDVMSGMNYRRIVPMRAGVPVEIRIVNVDSSYREGNNPYSIRVFHSSLLGVI